MVDEPGRDPERFVELDGLGTWRQPHHDDVGRRRFVGLGLRVLSLSPQGHFFAGKPAQGARPASQCSPILYEQNILRDTLGRAPQGHFFAGKPAQGARSVSTFWGNPDDRDLVDRPLPWRGYTYDDQRRLSAVFEHAGAVDPLTAGFGSHDITNQSITSFVSQSTSSEPIAQVDWVREPNVGSLQAIQEVGAPTARWSESGRGDGYQLGTVDLDNTTYPIAHDAMGRVTTGAGGTYAYGPRGRLPEAEQAGLYEFYLYDASGRLAQVLNGRNRTIIHDGDQLIAAMNLDGTARWEAVHGVGIDDILEFERVNDQLSGQFVAVKDHRNSVVGWFNIDNSSLEQTIDYTPHGRLIVTGPDGVEHCREEGTGTDCMVQENLPPFGFAGAYRSTRTGITYMRNRWYSPKLGQLTSSRSAALRRLSRTDLEQDERRNEEQSDNYKALLLKPMRDGQSCDGRQPDQRSATWRAGPP